MDWGICTTAIASPDVLEVFLRHHLNLGAAHIWLHLDDPGAEAPNLPDVTVIRCDDAWWGPRRPDRHQNRQSRNMRRLYDAAPLPWIAHIDVDEAIWPHSPISDVLAASDAIMVRMRPWEALHDPGHAGPFAATAFRAPLADVAHRAEMFGSFADLLPRGALGHTVGKAIFRTGVPGLEPRLHGGFLNGERITRIGFSDALPLLHFHAQDRSAWLDRLPFRLERGAYRSNEMLHAFLSAATEAEVATFYDRVMAPSADARARLHEAGLLIAARIGGA